MFGPEVIKTRVGIVGGGPAGLMLSHLLAGAGIDSVVVDNREHETIRTTHRAGILEHGSVNMLVESGISERVLTAGHKHEGIDLRFGGESHRIDFTDLVGEAVWLYPQNEVFVDLAAARRRDGGDVRFGVTDTAVSDLTGDTPRISFTEADGVAKAVHAEILIGADGSQGITSPTALVLSVTMSPRVMAGWLARTENRGQRGFSPGALGRTSAMDRAGLPSPPLPACPATDSSKGRNS